MVILHRRVELKFVLTIYGVLFGDGFDFTDAYVVCKELGLGVSGILIICTITIM